MILRLSQKLSTKINAGKLAEMPLDENPYADWSRHLFTADRTQYIILSNTASLYSCVMYGRGVTDDSRFGRTSADNQWRIALRSLTIWIVLIVAEIIHGIVRAVLLVPMVGEFRSNQIGVFTGSVIILVIAYFTIRWIGAKRPRDLLLVGFIWLALTVGFEMLFGRFVMGLAWEKIFAGYDIAKGGLMPLGLLILLFSLSSHISA
jgi:hypothetical protein